MSNRIKTFAIIAILGFVIGIIAKVAADHISTWIEANTTSLAGITPYILAGIAGAILTIVIVIIWAHLTSKKNKY
ncbi:MAG: hypothetical protein FWE56_03460 [Candidatus Bathyarchaeota archaeon]|nr:hypothetical protein [Candidatus Termiticorpusculum sp.]